MVEHSAKYIYLSFVSVQYSLIQGVQYSLIQGVFIAKKCIRKMYMKSVVGNLDHGFPLFPYPRVKVCLRIEGNHFQHVSNTRYEMLHMLYEKI